VDVGHYSEALQYSGKLLVEAKAVDADSKHASFTAFAAVCAGGGAFFCDMPNPGAALSYEKNFPDGPFIEDTLVILGMFYDDLFKAYREDKQGYKYECFSKYMKPGNVTGQRDFARKSALRYYQKVLTRRSENRAAIKSIAEWKRDLLSGKSLGWHFCAD
jgi:hypothetical protein